jgi:hypothetical protein
MLFDDMNHCSVLGWRQEAVHAGNVPAAEVGFRQAHPVI